MNLEQLRKQAKELVRAARAGDPKALARLGDLKPILASAQLSLARENGYSSWPALVAGVEANAEAFVLAATEQRRARAEAMLAAQPEIQRDTWAALVLGRRWNGDPNAPGGPRGWAPLLYVCHSVFASAELARDLLGRGADPNAFFTNEHGAMSALYGAAGVVHDPELTRVLLEAGANPNDGESLYHATQAESTDCLRLLLEHGAEPNGTNALAHALDYARLDHVRLLLEAGADPKEAAILVHAVRRGRGPEFLRLLASHDAELDARGSEGWRRPRPTVLRTAYQHAVLRGRRDQAEALAELGASTEIDPRDGAVAAIASGERAAHLPEELDYDAQEALILATLNGYVDLVVDAVGPNFRGVFGGSPAGSLLHAAAWHGRPDIVQRLLDRGADATAPRTHNAATPLGWAAHGSRNCDEHGPRDYVAVAEHLVAAGNPLDPDELDDAEGELAAWLEERLAM